MAVSMGDVARHAGVSQRTVSNVVNDYPHVAPATRAKVEESLRELGYRPNAAARSLRRGRTDTVTFAIPGFGERYFADLAEAVIVRAEQIGIRVLIETTAGEHSRELELLRGGGSQLTDGVIMSALSLGPDDEAGARAEYPLVLVGDREFGGPVDHVGIPNRQAARAAVEHLITTGRRRIALLGEIERQPAYTYSLRRAGYEEALGAAGIEVDERIVLSAEWNREEGESAIDDLIASRAPLPDGIFGMNDSVSLGAIRALQRHGVTVPDDVSVVGFDDIAESRHSTPTLSSIRPSLDEIARDALELLGEQFEHTGDDRVAQHRHVGFELQVRESSTRPDRA